MAEPGKFMKFVRGVVIFFLVAAILFTVAGLLDLLAARVAYGGGNSDGIPSDAEMSGRAP